MDTLFLVAVAFVVLAVTLKEVEYAKRRGYRNLMLVCLLVAWGYIPLKIVAELQDTMPSIAYSLGVVTAILATLLVVRYRKEESPQ